MGEAIAPPPAEVDQAAVEHQNLVRRLAKLAGVVALVAAGIYVGHKTGLFPTQGPNP